MQRAELEWIRSLTEGISKGEFAVETADGLVWKALKDSNFRRFYETQDR